MEQRKNFIQSGVDMPFLPKVIETALTTNPDYFIDLLPHLKTLKQLGVPASLIVNSLECDPQVLY